MNVGRTHKKHRPPAEHRAAAPGRRMRGPRTWALPPERPERRDPPRDPGPGPEPDEQPEPR